MLTVVSLSANEWIEMSQWFVRVIMTMSAEKLGEFGILGS